MESISSISGGTEFLLDSHDLMNDCYAFKCPWGDEVTDLVDLVGFFHPDTSPVSIAHDEPALPSTPCPPARVDSRGPIVPSIPLYTPASAVAPPLDHQLTQNLHLSWKEPRSAVPGFSSEMVSSFPETRAATQTCLVENRTPQCQSFSSQTLNLSGCPAKSTTQYISPINSPLSEPTTHIPRNVIQHSSHQFAHSFSSPLLAGSTLPPKAQPQIVDPHSSRNHSAQPTCISSRNVQTLNHAPSLMRPPVLHAEKISPAQTSTTLAFQENNLNAHQYDAAYYLGARVSEYGVRNVTDAYSAVSRNKPCDKSDANPKNASGGLRHAVKKLQKKRKRAQFKNPKPSNHCHICTHKKELHETRVCMCIRDGLCRKVFCKQCFEREGLSLDNGFDARGEWLCFHCRNECPDRAQCYTYNKINENIRHGRIRQKPAKLPRIRSKKSIKCNIPSP